LLRKDERIHRQRGSAAGLQIGGQVLRHFEQDAADTEARRFLGQRRELRCGNGFGSYGRRLHRGGTLTGFLLLARALVLLGVG